jgi:hypothetical protein
MDKFEKLVFGVGWTISRVSTQAIITLVRSHQFSGALVLEESYAARGQYVIAVSLFESRQERLTQPRRSR